VVERDDKDTATVDSKTGPRDGSAEDSVQFEDAGRQVLPTTVARMSRAQHERAIEMRKGRGAALTPERHLGHTDANERVGGGHIPSPVQVTLEAR
jgi:hypothetical protein